MTNLFKNNTPIVGDIKDGAYKVALDTTAFEKKGYAKELDGVYYNALNKRYIVRFKCIEGEYTGVTFSVYATEIDLSIMLADFATQLGKTIATPIEIVKTISETPVEIYRGIDEYISNGVVGKARKWYGNATRFRTIQETPVETESEDIL